MGCEICGRNSCAKSFHSLNEQNEFDSQADKVKDRMKEDLIRKLDRVKGEYIDDDYYIKLSDAIEIVEGY